MMSALCSLVVPEAVVMTTLGADSYDKIGIMSNAIYGLFVFWNKNYHGFQRKLTFGLQAITLHNANFLSSESSWANYSENVIC